MITLVFICISLVICKFTRSFHVQFSALLANITRSSGKALGHWVSELAELLPDDFPSYKPPFIRDFPWLSLSHMLRIHVGSPWNLLNNVKHNIRPVRLEYLFCLRTFRRGFAGHLLLYLAHMRTWSIYSLLCWSPNWMFGAIYDHNNKCEHLLTCLVRLCLAEASGSWRSSVPKASWCVSLSPMVSQWSSMICRPQNVILTLLQTGPCDIPVPENGFLSSMQLFTHIY